MSQHVLLCLKPNHKLAERILLTQKSLVKRTHDFKPNKILAVAVLFVPGSVREISLQKANEICKSLVTPCTFLG